MRQIKRFKNDILIDELLAYQESTNEQDVELEDWEEIEPKYYIDKSDDMIFEIWYDRTGIILDRGLNQHIKNDEISNDWGIGYFEEISKEYAMNKYKERLSKEQELAELNREVNKYAIGDMVVYEGKEKKILSFRFNMPDLSYVYMLEGLYHETLEDELNPLLKNCFKEEPSINEWTKPMRCKSEQAKEEHNFIMGVDYAKNNDLADSMEFCYYGAKDKSKENTCGEGEAQDLKQQNNGGSSDWYSLPDNAKTLQDLIEHRNMNGSVKDMFKACYRLGIKTKDELRDLNKTAYYALREIGRVSGRKDYITIAKELIGSQAIEKE